jgi:hypothetical protein
MNRRISLLLGAAFVALTVAACEGPTGPAGPVGPEGPQGPPGPQGPAGADAVNTCAQCHGNDATLLAIEWQFKESAHYNSVYYHREGACMACHNHQGFITTAVNGEALPPYFDNPAPINCRTCHEIHTTFTAGDYALTTTAPVDLAVGATANLGGAGNLCSNCHQIRPISPMPTVGGNPVTVPNFRYGPHYGPQANVTAATGAFHFPGSMTIPSSPNAHGMAGCETCHMVRPEGGNAPYAGGHTWMLSYGENGENQLVRACTQCHFHANTTSFDDRNYQSYIKAFMDELRDLLIAEGIMRQDGYAIPGTFDADVAAAFLNHRIFYYDGSYGVHNPQYAYAVLNNTLEVMRARQ